MLIAGSALERTAARIRHQNAVNELVRARHTALAVPTLHSCEPISLALGKDTIALNTSGPFWPKLV